MPPREAQPGARPGPLLAGRVAFVTGAASGIGAAIATRMAEEGASVLVGDLDEARAQERAADLTGRGLSAAAVGLDVTEPRSVEGALQAALKLHGRVDTLVANAGVLHNGPLLDTSDGDWKRVLDVNLTGVFHCLRAFGSQLVRQGQGGSLIATSSIAGKRGGRLYGAYTASKFGVIGLVECLAPELAEHGITVNAVCPGTVETPMIRQLYEEHGALRELSARAVRDETVGSIPFGRMADPREIADVFVFLASPLARYVTGESIVVDGGQLVGP